MNKIIGALITFKQLTIAPILIFVNIGAVAFAYSPESPFIDSYIQNKIKVSQNNNEKLSGSTNILSSSSNMYKNKDSKSVFKPLFNDNLSKSTGTNKTNFQYSKDISRYSNFDNNTIKSDFVNSITQRNTQNNSSSNELLRKKIGNIGIIKQAEIEISKIGIFEPLYIMKVGDMDLATLNKSDKDLIDAEFFSLSDMNKGFLIGGHSSGYWWDTSTRKEIFKNLKVLELGDTVKISFKGTLSNSNITFRVKDRKIGSDITVNEGDFILYTCHPYNTSKERLVLFLEIISNEVD